MQANKIIICEYLLNCFSRKLIPERLLAEEILVEINVILKKLLKDMELLEFLQEVFLYIKEDMMQC